MARFFRRGKTRVFFLPTIVSGTKAPTVAEITAGTDLSLSTNDITGFSFANQPIDVPDLASAFTSKIPGPDEADDSTLKLYVDSVTNPLLTTLAKDVAGYIVIKDYKIGAMAAADKVDTWPIIVASTAKDYSLGNDPATFTSTFTITSPPAVEIAVLP